MASSASQGTRVTRRSPHCCGRASSPASGRPEHAATLDALATEYGADKNTISRAISEVLEPEGLVWAVPKRGTIVRHGMARPHRMRGNLVKRNVATERPRLQLPFGVRPGGLAASHHARPRSRKS